MVGTVQGTEGDDIIDAGYTGDPHGDRVDDGVPYRPGAGPNDDFIKGYGGNDTIRAGKGNDVVYGGQGDDVIYGGPGDDWLYGDEGNDTIYGGAGNDHIFGGDGNDVLKGEEGDDVIHTGGGLNLVYGGTGNDTVYLGNGENWVFGGDDRDVFYGGTGGSYIDGGSGGDDWDILDLTGVAFDRIEYISDDREDGYVWFHDGTRMEFKDIEKIIPCFTPGTTIATPRGERLVEELREGDRIITRDNGIQEIRWVGRKDVTGRDLLRTPHLKPILIKAGALGNGLPERDMLVSPNHRVLVSNDRTQLYFDESEVLVAAKHLIGSAGVMELDVMGTSYIHFMFDRHEVVLSNGAWTESFQPGDYSLKGIGNAQRGEIFELFPELASKTGLESYQAARKSLKKHEARLLVR